MRETPKKDEVYEHFKGYRYQIIALAKNADTKMDMVVYQETSEPYQIFVLDLNDFLSPIDHVEHPESKQENRFEKCKIEEELHPKIAEFLDAETYEEKLRILISMEHIITNSMINTMEIVLDVAISEGELEERYDALKSSLRMLEKFECNRFR